MPGKREKEGKIEKETCRERDIEREEGWKEGGGREAAARIHFTLRTACRFLLIF